MASLPVIDPANVVPPFEEIMVHMADLSDQASKFQRQYEGSTSLLARQGLIDAILWYGRLQEAGSGAMHIAEFIETKYPNSTPVVKNMRASVMNAMRETGFFAEFLMGVPAKTLEEYSKEPALLKCAPFLRYMARPDIRQRKALPGNVRQKIIARLQSHLNRMATDEMTFSVMNVLANAFVEASHLGFANPLLASEKKDFLEDQEVSALRQALSANRDVLQFYIRSRNLPFFPEHAPYGQLIDVYNLLDWKTAADLAVKGNTAFSPELGKTAANIFEKGWVEASPVIPSMNVTIMASQVYPPMVFLGFAGSLFQSQELSHEIGHAVHCLRRSLARELKPFDSIAINEVFPDLQERMYWHQVGLSPTVQKVAPGIDASAHGLDNFAGFIGRFAVIDGFQKTACLLLSRDQKSSARDLDRRWSKLQEDYFGTEASINPRSWRGVPFIIENPFGAISYIYAQLVAERMWQEHQKDPEGFAPKLVRFLDDGSKMPPAELLKPIGFDTSSPQFWSEAFRDIRGAVSAMTGKPLPAPRL